MRARLAAGAARAGRWAGVRKRGAEAGRCELGRRGSADARGPAGSGRVRAERSARAEALAVGSGGGACLRAERAERREEGARAWAALAAELGRSGTRARLR